MSTRESKNGIYNAKRSIYRQSFILWNDMNINFLQNVETFEELIMLSMRQFHNKT